MTFSEWLKMDEMWRPDDSKAIGSAERQQMFHAPNPAERPVPPQRNNNRFQSYDQRVQYGKGIEKQIFDTLVSCGMQLREPTSQEDMYDKIDGWWNTGTKEEPIQIKYRDTGADILFEVMKDYHRHVPGRDMIGKAAYYAVMTGGNIVVVEVEQAKKMIREAVRQAEGGGFNPRGDYQTTEGLSLKLRPDPRSGQTKLMAYIPVNILRNVRPPCKANVVF